MALPQSVQEYLLALAQRLFWYSQEQVPGEIPALEYLQV